MADRPTPAPTHQSPDWVPPRPPERPTLNRFAVASLVLSVFGGVLGIVCGIIALRQIRRTGQRGRALAVDGIGASVMVLLVVLGVAAWQGIAGVDRVDPLYVSAGDCLNGVRDPDADRLLRVSCDRPHDAEVFATFDLQTDVADLDSYAERACAGELDRYAPGASSDPSLAVRIRLVTFSRLFGRGHRIVCLLEDANGARRTGTRRG
jgi:Domain of unknown function (DUF4190)